MHKTNVLITIDSEHSIGGAFSNPSLKPVGNDRRIFGRFNGKEYGIPLIMDIADRYGIPLTFFVEVLNKHYFGESETREVCEYILGRGHDVQLHLHPGWLNFKTRRPAAKKYADNISAYDLQAQIQLIAEGKDMITRYCGRPPVAFRAGNYGADYNTLKALKANSICIDSSYNVAFSKHSRRICREPINDAALLDKIWELPITNFIESIPFFKQRHKPLDINGVSFGEIKSVLQQSSIGKGPKTVTIIMHSFSFLKAKDMQYKNCGIRKYVVNRFEKLCQHLADETNSINCMGVSQIVKSNGLNVQTTYGNIFPAIPAITSIFRGFEQILSETLTNS